MNIYIYSSLLTPHFLLRFAAAAIASGIALSFESEKSPTRTRTRTADDEDDDDVVPDAVEKAVRYVEAAIRTGFDLGKGNGPINHFHSLLGARGMPSSPPEFPSLESTLRRRRRRVVYRGNGGGKA